MKQFDPSWRTKKSEARLLATCNLDDRKPAACAMFVPAMDHLCCLAAMKNGLIDRHTLMIIVERDMQSFLKVKAKYYELVKSHDFSKDVVFFPNLLHKINLSGLPNINYAFLDWYDEINGRNLKFITEVLTRHLSRQADIVLTFSLNERRNHFADAILQFLSSAQGDKIIHECEKIWRYSPDSKATKVLACMRLAFHHFQFESLHDPFGYHDSAKKMLYIRLTNIIRSKSVFSPSISAKFTRIIEDSCCSDRGDKHDLSSRTVFDGSLRLLEMNRYKQTVLCKEIQMKQKELNRLIAREELLSKKQCGRFS